MLNLIRPNTPEYDDRASDALSFLLRHGMNQYTDNSFSLAREAIDREEVPVVTYGEPTRFDPDTEAILGGVKGVLIPMSDRALMVVHPDHRREGIGSSLLNKGLSWDGSLKFWVHRTNYFAQQFLLSNRFSPDTINIYSQVRYTR